MDRIKPGANGIFCDQSQVFVYLFTIPLIIDVIFKPKSLKSLKKTVFN